MLTGDDGVQDCLMSKLPPQIYSRECLVIARTPTLTTDDTSIVLLTPSSFVAHSAIHPTNSNMTRTTLVFIAALATCQGFAPASLTSFTRSVRLSTSPLDVLDLTMNSAPLDAVSSLNVQSSDVIGLVSSSMVLSETDPWVQPLALVLGPFLNLFSFAMVSVPTTVRWLYLKQQCATQSIASTLFTDPLSLAMSHRSLVVPHRKRQRGPVQHRSVAYRTSSPISTRVCAPCIWCGYHTGCLAWSFHVCE